ncbi:oligosaccharide flippase family protein [Bradyrhizobium sp. CW9]|nr:oligosaccharide flippase family protein [Bradyrhizobium sp. CW9]
MNVYRATLQFLFNAALTHYLTPAEFGIVNFILPLVTLVVLLGDFGLSTAIVRDRDLGAREAGAAFTLSIFFALLIGLAVDGSLLAFSYANGPIRDVAPIIFAFSVMPLLSLATIVPRSLVERKLAYPEIAAVEAAAISIGAVCGLVCALRGAGAWSLVVFHLSTQLIRFIGFFVRSRADIRFNLRWALTRRLLSFGGWVFGSSLLTFLFRNGDNIIIGAMLGSAALGAYSFAYQFILLPLMILTWPASGVLLATFSRDRLDIVKARKIVGSVVCLTALVTFPAAAFIVVEGPEVLYYVLGPRWQVAAQIAAILAPIGALQSLSSYVGPILLLRGWAKPLFLLNLSTTISTLLLFVAVSWFGLGIVELCWAYLVFSAIVFTGILVLMFCTLGMRWSSVVDALWVPCLASILSATSALIAKWLHSESFSVSGLICSSLAFAAVTILTFILHKSVILRHLASVVGVGRKSIAAAGSAP